MADQNSNALAAKPESAMARVKNYMLSPEVKERFSEMMGRNGLYYLNQVMIVVAANDELQKCEPKSILLAAMRAASLKLSVDPGQGQAWIIPYKGEATFQLGYRGVYELAMRTNLYRVINVIDIFEGEELIENRMTGNHTIGGKRTGNAVIAYMLYFQLFNGFEKTFVMTIPEIETHAKRYSKAYQNPRSKWNDPVERPKMERKTVMVNGLRKWGRFNQNDADLLDEIESEQGFTGGSLPEEVDISVTEETPKRSEAEMLAGLGVEPDGKKPPQPAQPDRDAELLKAASFHNRAGKAYGDMTIDELTVIIDHNATPAPNRAAAKLLHDALVEREINAEQQGSLL